MSIDVLVALFAGFVLGQVVTVLWVMSTLQEDEDEEDEVEDIDAETISEGSVDERRVDTGELDKGVRNDGGLHCDQEGDQRKEAGREVVVSVLRE